MLAAQKKEKKEKEREKVVGEKERDRGMFARNQA